MRLQISRSDLSRAITLGVRLVMDPILVTEMSMEVGGGAMNSGADWPAYFAMHAGRSVHPDFLDAYESVPLGVPGAAIDLGAGDGTESVFLLVRGWKVHAFDITPDLRGRITSKLDTDPGESLIAADISFADITELPSADFIYAGLSLPFAQPNECRHILRLIHGALTPQGLFAAHFFGENDSWSTRPDVHTHTQETLTSLLKDFTDTAIEDREYDGNSGKGPKHWHIKWLKAHR